MNKLLVEGKACIVSGASYGMGKEMAAVLAAEGGNVIMTARGKEKLEAAAEEIRAAGGNVIPVVADASSVEDIQKVVALAIEKFGRIDVLVNNAAIGEMHSIEAVTDELIDDVLNVDIKGPMVFCREVLKYMKEQKSGSIVNISSVNGVRPMCGITYSSAKGALNTFTKALAIRLVGTGIRCNAVAPGFTYTPTAAHHEEVPHTLEDGMMNEIRDARTVRGEQVFTYPADQANAVLFFASDMSKSVTGQILVVDNGSYL